jgi:hypothetical protein
LFQNIDINDFKANVPTGGNVLFDFGGNPYPLDNDVAFARAAAAANQWTWYYLTVGQLSAYAQDEWQATDRFRLTFGVRMDMPVYFKDKFRFVPAGGEASSPTLPNNDNLTLFDADGRPVTNGEGKQLDNTRLPTKTPLISPRVGFNWDVKGDKSLQVRGGSGLFTGRFPFVWLGNHIGNPFSFFYNVTDKDFKWPQVWRSNIGTDFKIPSGTIFTIDVAYTKDINAMMVRNYKLGTPTGILNSATGDRRSVYLPANQGSANTYVFTNTKVGYQFNVSLQAQKTFRKGLYVMAGYNYNVSKDASSISAEISSDAFDRNPILNNANKAINSHSLYGNKHRIIAVASKRCDYGAGKWATTFSVFGSWTSGNRFAYVYGGDINNDGTASNDLLYVPTNAEIDAMNFTPFPDLNGDLQSPEVQRATFKNFIAQDKYLSKRRGQYTEKYAGETPWYGQVDLRILQDLNFKTGKKTSTIQLSIDVVNIGNLVSSEWGVRKYATTAGYFQPLSVSYNGNNPVYNFDPTLYSTFVSSPDLQSRWQMQLGLRYIF